MGDGCPDAGSVDVGCRERWSDAPRVRPAPRAPRRRSCRRRDSRRLAVDGVSAAIRAKLIEDVKRDPFTGIGKPEPLKYHLPGAWSRRIDDEHRLVYLVTDKEIVILVARYHY
jgi:Txe/YoeB family toxin of toxin-antitoxin system